MSIFIMISSNSWMGVWIGMELNLLSFLPLIIFFESSFSKEVCMKYFFIQVLASLWMLFSLFFGSSLGMFIIMICLMTKMGIFPMYFWFPPVCSGLSWMSFLFLITFQKLSPMFLMKNMLFYIEFDLIMMLLLGSLIVGSLGGLSHNFFRIFLSYSSIHHTGAMIMALMMSSALWLFYMFIYIYINYILIQNILLSKKEYISDFLKGDMKDYIQMFLNLFSLGGFPPLLGFIPKMIIFLMLVSVSKFGFAYVLVVTSGVSLFYYLKMIFSSIMFSYVLYEISFFLVNFRQMIYFSLIQFSGLFFLCFLL
uniref:NADH dehydrogenase subunit 2 n=1 Tax=Spelaeomysis bottazzii TaxID=2970448 RepID=UPI002176E431|nr:NADH dehydrogenase subunit 2 [Spelaeomysis bottazzii]UUL70728.1 NADH dehydrogenase subunit 2 [Spelaeomysis bottazzii]